MNISLIKYHFRHRLTFIGTIAMALYSLRRGKELEDDPEYQRRLKIPYGVIVF